MVHLVLLQLADGPDTGNQKQLRTVDGARAENHLPPHADPPHGAVFVYHFDAVGLLILEQYLILT